VPNARITDLQAPSSAASAGRRCPALARGRVAPEGALLLTRARDWSVENPVNSTPDLAGAPYNPAIGLPGGQWRFSCSSARMDHNELRVRIRQLIASGEPPPVPPLAKGNGSP